MPSDNIERAIARGSGTGEGGALEELVYEGYAPGGVALLVETATDNSNRTVADLRVIFSKHGGHLASPGSVSFHFRRKGQITVPLAAAGEDRVLEAALDAGAEDVSADEEHHVVLTAHDRLYAVGEALRRTGIEPDALRLTFLPDSFVAVADDDAAARVIRLCQALEGNDDVQHVHANLLQPAPATP